MLYATTGGVIASTGAGTATQVLTSNGAGMAPTFQAGGGGGGGFTPNSTINIFSDFLSYSVLTDAGGFGDNILVAEEVSWDLGIGLLPSGTGTAAVLGNPGLVWSPSLGAGAVFQLVMSQDVNTTTILLGAGAITCNWVFKINTLSTGTNRYVLKFGMGNGDNCSFIYSEQR